MTRLQRLGRLALLAGLAAQGPLVHAQSSTLPTALPTGWQCDGSFSLITGSDLSATCSGSLSLTDVTLTAAHSLTLQADHDLSLLGVNLSAPSITLIGGTSIALDSHSALNIANGQPQPSQPATPGAVLMVGGSSYIVPVLDAGGLSIGPDTPVVAGGGVELAPVPEPSTWALSLLGLGTAATVARRRRH